MFMRTGALFGNLSFDIMNRSLAEWICTIFYVGKLPFAPGTWGSLVGALIWFIIFPHLPKYLPILIVLCVFILGVYASNILVEGKKDKDPSRIVIDEVVGQWIALLGSPFNVYYLVSGFVIFRIFDILKPPIVKKYEKLPHGWGIMVDDIAAGLLTLFILFAVQLFL